MGLGVGDWIVGVMELNVLLGGGAWLGGMRGVAWKGLPPPSLLWMLSGYHDVSSFPLYQALPIMPFLLLNLPTMKLLKW